MSYENKHKFRDGHIFLYTRNGKPTYHARIKIDGVNGYIIRSTKRKSLAEAVRFSEDLYDDMRYKVRHGLEVKPHTFLSLWERWSAANQKLRSEHRQKYFIGTARRYFLPYFGDKSLEEINDYFVEKYWGWRINYWSSEDGLQKIHSAQKSRTTQKRSYKQKLGNVAKIPSQKTLQMEQSALRQIFHWAKRNGIVSNMPEIKAPKIRTGHGIERRPAFDLPDWQKLYRHLRKWVNEESDLDIPEAIEDSTNKKKLTGKRINSYHRWQREMIRNYILFMGTSGLRPNEAHQLRWKDIEVFEDNHSVNQLILHISPTTKTGYRECIPLRSAKRYLDRILKFSAHTSPDNFIFCHRNGRPIKSFGKTFKSILTEANLLKDRHGNVRTIYSLRHTYATFKLLYGHVNIEDLAQNMGTSPTQIFNHYRHITVRQKAHDLGGSLHQNKSRQGLIL